MVYNTKFGGTHEAPRSHGGKSSRGGKAVNNERKTFLQEKSERIKALKEKEDRTPEETQEIVGDIFAMRQAAGKEMTDYLYANLKTLDDKDVMKDNKHLLNRSDYKAHSKEMQERISEIRIKLNNDGEITSKDMNDLNYMCEAYATLKGNYIGHENAGIKRLEDGSEFGLNKETIELLGKDEGELTKELTQEVVKEKNQEHEKEQIVEMEKTALQELAEKNVPTVAKAGSSAELKRQEHLKEMGDTLANLDVENLSREDADAALKLTQEFRIHAATELSNKLGNILLKLPSGAEKEEMSDNLVAIKSKLHEGEEVTKDDLATLNGIRLAVGDQLIDGNPENKYAQAILSGAKFNMTKEAIDFALDDEKLQKLEQLRDDKALEQYVEKLGKEREVLNVTKGEKVHVSFRANEKEAPEMAQTQEDITGNFTLDEDEQAQINRMMGVEVEEPAQEQEAVQEAPVNEHVEAFKQMDPQEFTQPELSAQDAYVANLVKESVEQTVEKHVVEEPNVQLDEKVLAAEELLNNMHQENLNQKAKEPDLNINTSAQFEYTETTTGETLAQNGYEDPSSVAYEMPEAEVEENILMEEIRVTNEDRIVPKEKEKPSLMARMRAGLASTKEAIKEKLKPYVLAASMRKETAKVKDENIAFEPQKTAMTGYDEDDLEVSTADLEVAAQEFREISQETLNKEPANDISHGIVLEEEGREEEVGLVMNG